MTTASPTPSQGLNDCSLADFFPTTLRLLAHFPMRRCIPAPEFRERDALNGNGANLKFHDIEIEGIGQLRVTLIEGGKAQIFNAMVFPNSVERLPVFASEIVVFGGKVRVAVIDLQPLCNFIRMRYWMTEQISPLRALYSDLPQEEKMPEWCLSHFTPHSIFTRSNEEHSISRILEAYIEYLDLFVELALGTWSAKPALDCRLLREYKDHHITHTPGLPFLGKMFGEDWTHRYLREAMYA